MPSHLYDMRFWFSRAWCFMEIMVGLLNQTRSCISDNFYPIASRLIVLLTSCIYCHRSAMALLIVDEMRGCSTLIPPARPPSDPSLVLIKKKPRCCEGSGSKSLVLVLLQWSRSCKQTHRTHCDCNPLPVRTPPTDILLYTHRHTWLPIMLWWRPPPGGLLFCVLQLQEALSLN